DRHHAFLALTHEDLLRGETAVTQRNPLQVDPHTAGATRGQFGGGTGDPGGTKILNPHNQILGEQFQTALDEQLLQKRITDLHVGPLDGRLLVESGTGQHRGATNTVGSGSGTEQNHLVTRAGRLGQLDVLVLHHTHTQGVDQRVTEVVRTKTDL